MSATASGHPRTRRPRSVAAVLALTTLAAVLLGPVAAMLVPAAPPAVAAETTALPATLGLGGPGAPSVRIVVPPGVLPTAVTGRLTVVGSTEDPADDEVTVLVGDRVATTVPARTGDIAIAVSSDDVVDGALELGVRHAADPSCPSPTGPTTLTLDELALDSTGVEAAPQGTDDFWPATASRIDVVVPGRADDPLLEAALDAVAALSRRYGPDTPVVLSSASTQLPRTGFGQRVLRLASGEGAVQASLASRFGLAELDLTGAADELQSAVRALAYGDDLTAQAPANPQPAAERTFVDLGAPTVSFGGDTGAVGVVRVPQDAFGMQVATLRIRASGTRSDLVEGDTGATVDTYVNDVLVDSLPLDPDDEDVEIDTTVDAAVLRPANTVRFAVGSATDGACATAAGVAVTLDGDASTYDVTARDDAEAGAGDGAAGGLGLAAYPQNLQGELPVAIRSEGGLRLPAAADAAAVVSALQGAAAGLLDVSVVDADELVAGAEPGLLAGADVDDAATLEAPLQYQETADETLPAPVGIDVSGLFAALEAAAPAGREVLLLGSFGPGDRATQADLRATTARAAATLGWNALDGDLLVTPRDGAPRVTTAPRPEAPTAAPANDPGSTTGWLVGAAAVLLLLLGLQVRRGVRLDRRTRDAADDATA